MDDGWADILGDSEGIDVGTLVFVGLILGWRDGKVVGLFVGIVLSVGLRLGSSEGATLMDGGWMVGLVEIDGKSVGVKL